MYGFLDSEIGVFIQGLMSHATEDFNNNVYWFFIVVSLLDVFVVLFLLYHKYISRRSLILLFPARVIIYIAFIIGKGYLLLLLLYLLSAIAIVTFTFLIVYNVLLFLKEALLNAYAIIRDPNWEPVELEDEEAYETRKLED